MGRKTVGILGTGFGRAVQAVAFSRHPGFEVVAIAGSREDKTRGIAAELGIPRAYGNSRALLDEGVPDLVSVVTPVDLHHPMMLEALDRGAHVLCEKPTALHRFQAAEMRDRAEERGLVAGMNHEFRFFPARRHALSLVRKGDIGRPRRGEILGRYALWHSPAGKPMNWLSRRERGGGILGALGSHHTDCMRLFFGEPESVLATVRVDQPLRGIPDGEPPATATATADDAFTVQYRFAGGASAIIDVNATTPYRWERFEIHGDEGTLRWDETGYALWRVRPGGAPEPIEIPSEFDLRPREGDLALIAPFTALLDNLDAALAGRAPMEPNFDDAVAVQSALDAARASSLAGSWLSIERPPARAAR